MIRKHDKLALFNFELHHKTISIIFFQELSHHIFSFGENNFNLDVAMLEQTKAEMQTVFHMWYDPLQLLLSIKLFDLILSIAVAICSQKYELCYANMFDCSSSSLTFYSYSTAFGYCLKLNSVVHIKFCCGYQTFV